MVQQHQAHPWVLSFLLLLVGHEVPEDQLVPREHIHNRSCYYRKKEGPVSWLKCVETWFSTRKKNSSNYNLLISNLIDLTSDCYPHLLFGLILCFKNQGTQGQVKWKLTISPLGPASPLNPGIPGSPYGQTGTMLLFIYNIWNMNWMKWIINIWFSEYIQMFLWVREVQLLPEAREVHEVQGNQEHQRYQEHPTDKESERDVSLVSWLNTQTSTVSYHWFYNYNCHI